MPIGKHPASPVFMRVPAVLQGRLLESFLRVLPIGNHPASPVFMRVPAVLQGRLITKLGAPPGTACHYPSNIGKATVTPDAIKMNFDSEVADPIYLMHFFNPPTSKPIIESLCFGVTRLRIDISMFKTFPVPLPPRLEQSEVIRRVDALFAFADRLEARLAKAQATADRLTPALLVKAFQGELVPQDPNDEPASELLRRLANCKATATSKASAATKPGKAKAASGGTADAPRRGRPRGSGKRTKSETEPTATDSAG